MDALTFLLCFIGLVFCLIAFCGAAVILLFHFIARANFGSDDE